MKQMNQLILKFINLQPLYNIIFNNYYIKTIFKGLEQNVCLKTNISHYQITQKLLEKVEQDNLKF